MTVEWYVGPPCLLLTWVPVLGIVGDFVNSALFGHAVHRCVKVAVPGVLSFGTVQGGSSLFIFLDSLKTCWFISNALRRYRTYQQSVGLYPYLAIGPINDG